MSLYGHDDMDYTYDAAEYVPEHIVPIYTLYSTPRIFAGWYYDEDFNIPFTDDHGLAFGRFIDANVLNIASQIGSLADGTTALRFFSSVDTLAFNKVGFEIVTATYGDREIHNYELSSNKVYSSLKAEGEPINIKTMFKSNESEYFIAACITGLDYKNTESSWTIKPWYETLDGTKVYGEEKTFEVFDEIITVAEQ